MARLTRDQLTAEVRLLELRPGDVLVVECDTAEVAEEVAGELREHGIPFRAGVLVLGPGVRVRVAREVDA